MVNKQMWKGERIVSHEEPDHRVKKLHDAILICKKKENEIKKSEIT